MNTHDAANGKSVDDTGKLPRPKSEDLDRRAPQPDPQAGSHAKWAILKTRTRWTMTALCLDALAAGWPAVERIHPGVMPAMRASKALICTGCSSRRHDAVRDALYIDGGRVRRS